MPRTNFTLCFVLVVSSMLCDIMRALSPRCIVGKTCFIDGQFEVDFAAGGENAILRSNLEISEPWDCLLLVLQINCGVFIQDA